jgi:3-oxoacyl-[acyl-carrier-protein] synthase III
MAKSTFHSSRISGLVTVVPPHKKCIDDEVDLYGGNMKQVMRIKQTIGLSERYVVDQNTTTVDLCTEAAQLLIKGLSISRDAIDGLILVTQTPDYFQPFSAAVMHDRLKLSTNCASFDVNLGCSGYVYGLWLASMMVESGGCKNVLLLAGDTMSRCVNRKDRAIAPLFGDAGSATFVQRDDQDRPSYFCLNTDGSGFQHLMVKAGAFRHPKSQETSQERKDAEGNIRSDEDLYMNGGEIFNFSIKEEPLAIQEILAYAGKGQEDIDYIVFHQANKYIISNIARRLKFPLEKTPCETTAKYGNQSSASIPATICDALHQQVSQRTLSLIMSGFGVGLSWASCLVTLDFPWCPGIQFLSKG